MQQHLELSSILVPEKPSEELTIGKEILTKELLKM